VADKVTRRWTAHAPAPLFEHTDFTLLSALDQARIAIVTTAGLMRPGEPLWGHSDTSFRSFDKRERQLLVGHVSMNFDRVGVASDLNVVYPIDRLEELAHRGVIGEVAENHLSFMGATYDLPTIVLDTGPAAARALLDDGVDAVILTPV
jgi:D-proline reductase (dithiol) PrdB